MSVRATFAMLCLVATANAAGPADETTTDWSAVDARPTPTWWSDAKFGVFIHWGVYSVPAFAPKGEYAEWYWERLRAPGNPASARDQQIRAETRAFHERNFGKDFDYANFAPQFRAEFFDADKWARLLRDSGAKYVVLVSKHHDGFALWPSKEADASWGRPWNALAIGPKRDLVGELTTAVRAQGLQMGFYYSLYEWFNPKWLAGDRQAFVEQHLFPQFKDLVTRYRPTVIFSDGEWAEPSATWRSAELLTWLFNDSPVKDTVVVNDRWGKETRHIHGGYYTTEYGAGLPGADHAWEENRGMGFSYGYNRNEDLADYATGERLLLTLLDTVSRGGNLLLNIGPTADGRIPVEMQERLNYLGTWLRTNGEAVYGTRTFRDSAQWTAGRQPALDTSTNYRAKYDVEALTLHPAPGDARKEILFTRNGDTLYAILPLRPQTGLFVRNLKKPKAGRATVLGAADSKVEWLQVGRDSMFLLPALADHELPFDGPMVVKIEGLVGLD
ncbi:MAG TPA: alpha-L-fucosidase [Steroidobacteraceae bacterium]|nr:alpha-L-fucosidase [Steroidobacteraceae bacterium]